MRPGVVSSLRPHVSVPRTARDAFATAVPALMGIWGLAGFHLSLGPSLAAQLLHSQNLLWGGLLIFLLTGLAAAASALLSQETLHLTLHDPARETPKQKPAYAKAPARAKPVEHPPGVLYGWEELEFEFFPVG